MGSSLQFARPELAQQMAIALTGRHKFMSSADGLFLAAPRRTGKTTFLKGDLMPEFEATGVEVIYLDFWVNRRADPVDLLYAEVSRVLLANASVVARLAERARLQKVKLGTQGAGLEFDATRIGQSAASSLMAALRELIEATGKPVALILDEAQHLLVSERGEDVLRELKAARDTLNTPNDVRLRLVMSGSDRDKLGRLTNSKSAAFCGSLITDLPLLDADYVAWVSGLLARDYPGLGSIDKASLLQSFERLGHRPLMLDRAIGRALNPVTRGDRGFEEAVSDFAQEIVQAEHARYADRFASLPATHRAVLEVLLRMGDDFSPFGAATLKACEQILGKKVPPSTVQSALEALRKLDPPLVWKSNRAEYALEDLAMVDWYRARVEAGEWPPA